MAHPQQPVLNNKKGGFNMSTPKGLKKEWYDKPKSERSRNHKPINGAGGNYSTSSRRLNFAFASTKSIIDHILDDNVDQVLILLRSGVDPTEEDEGYVAIPFLMACKYGKMEIMDAMLKMGVDANFESIRGHTPFLYVYVNGFADCMRLLLENGAKIPPRVHDTRDCGCGRDHTVEYFMIGEFEVTQNDEMEAILEEYELKQSVSSVQQIQQERNNSL
jgi:ankyrin repeat protein